MSSYIDHKDHDHEVVHSWSDHTRQRLEWLHGPEKAAAIMSGTDAKARADLAAWNSLGARDEAA